MSRGPIDFLLAEFHDGNFHGGMASALSNLIEQGTIRIVDLVFISKDGDGEISTFEVDSLDSEAARSYADLDGEFGGVLSDSDLEKAAADLPPNSAAGLVVWENLWAQEFVEALEQAGGTVSALIRIPAADVDRALAGLESA